MFYNQRKNSGWLVTALKTRREGNKAGHSSPDYDMAASNDARDNDEDELENEEESYSDEQAKSDVEYMKNNIYDKNTSENFETKLKLTFDYRMKIIKDCKSKVLIEFPFLFCHADLVCNKINLKL